MIALAVQASLYDAHRIELVISDQDHAHLTNIGQGCGIPVRVIDLSSGEGYKLAWINCGSSYRDWVVLAKVNPLDILAIGSGALTYEKLTPAGKEHARMTLAGLLDWAKGMLGNLHHWVNAPAGLTQH